jgi:hypothetical protein
MTETNHLSGFAKSIAHILLLGVIYLLAGKAELALAIPPD